MKELFYRRDNKGGGGYKVVAREASISAKEVAFGSQKALPVSAMEIPLLTYKQCCTDDGTLMVSCGYIDPYGSRGSSLTHVLLTQSEAECAALLDAYPASSPYFEEFRALYSSGSEPIDLEAKDLNVPLEAFLGNRRESIEAAARLLRETFGSRELLAQVFAALLDVASPNPRMAVVALEGEAIEDLPERGRRIAEALFAFLPRPVAARLGYQSPALNLSDVTFSLRFVNDPAIAKSSMVYLINPSKGTITLPTGPKSEPGEYVESIVNGILSGDSMALDGIRGMRKRLSDRTMLAAKSFPQELAIRYALYTRPNALTPQERKQLLDWWHDAVKQAAEGRGEGLSALPFWPDVTQWIKNSLVPDLWAHRNEWKRGNIPYDPILVRLLFDDGQKLHEIGSGEAPFFRDHFARQLEQGTLAPDAEAGKLRSELIAWFCSQVEHAKDGTFTGSLLYWAPVKAYLCREWTSGALMRDGKAGGAVRKLYRIAPDEAAPFFEAYLAQIIRTKQPLCVGDGSEFHRDAVDRLFREHRDTFVECMNRELEGQDPFKSAQALQKTLWYMKKVRGDRQLEQDLRQRSERYFESALAATKAEDVVPMLEELAGGQGRGIKDVASQLLEWGPVNAAMERRVVELTKADGIYGLYPKKPDEARQLAALLDRANAYSGIRWAQRYEELEALRTLRAGEIAEDDFNRLAEAVGHFDDRQRNLARELLWASVRDAGKGGKTPVDGSLLWALAMRSCDAGTFSPSEICADAKKLDISTGQLRRFCAKHADVTADKGLGYVASETLKQLKHPEVASQEARIAYPREAGSAERPAPFSGLPMAVPAAGAALFGCGLAGSVVSLLKLVGLM